MVFTTTKLRHLLIASVLVLGLAAVAVPAPKASAAQVCFQYEYIQGNTGTCVEYIQEILNIEGNYFRYSGWSHLSTDGQFGSLTKTQVQKFQAFNGISQDGRVGPITKSNMCQRAYQIEAAVPSALSTIILMDDVNALYGC